MVRNSPDKVELVAEHALGKDDYHLFQVVLYPGSLLGGGALVLLAACEQHSPGRELWVEAQHKVLIRSTRVNHLLHNLLQ